MIRKSKVNKNFISNIDKRLAEFDKAHPRSESQLAEIKKYKRIFRLRDEPIHEQPPKEWWQE